MSDEWLAWEGMAKEIAMRGQEDEYFVDAGAALTIRSSHKYDEIGPKATLKIEGGSQQKDRQHCCKMMIVHTKGEYDDCPQDCDNNGILATRERLDCAEGCNKN